jgi:methyl-accepting chemotaxis protein
LTLPFIRKISIAAKLYAIFVLMATTTLALSVLAASTARHHAALTDEFEFANSGSRNVERINGLIYAVEASARGIYLSTDKAQAAPHVADLAAATDKIGAALAEWQVNVTNSDAKNFSDFAVRLAAFQQFPAELARIATAEGPQAARAWAQNNERSDTRDALAEDLAKFSRSYSAKAAQIYTRINEGVDSAGTMMSVLAALAILLAIAGAIVIARSITKPLVRIAEVTEAVAGGDVETPVPYDTRGDEIGALSRAIGVFQDAMRRNGELNRTVAADAETRSQRQQHMNAEIGRFSGDVEATLAELGRIADEMLGAAQQLSTAAGDAASKTARAGAASNEASANVRDIASAADELSASVNEIDRQVVQSNAIASKAVADAERSNEAVRELNEAAQRIGAVIKLITDIAEQTNLLALNATIEAARAGEAGRGFAVVAGEVKALAGQTGRATEEIGAQIAAMQRATARSIDAITAIERTIREIGDISGAIAAAVTEQGAATAEIARAVEIAAQRTVETADDVSLVGAATEDTRSSANSVKAVADDLGQVAQRIRGQVDQFFERLSA